MEEIDPSEIKPLHTVRQPAKLASLVRDMKRNGWQGRPLLVIASRGEYIAWTGSHRIAAALKAKLEKVPCYIVQEDDVIDGDNDARWGHVDDSDRLKLIRRTGDETAIRLMWQEGRID